MSKRAVLSIVSAMLIVIATYGKAALPKPCVVEGVTRQSVKEYCDTTALDAIEGVWSYPDDGMLMLITKVADAADIDSSVHYRIVVIESADQSLRPGQVIGYLAMTPEVGQFRLWMYTDISRRIPVRPEECHATLSDDRCGLAIVAKQYKLKINPFGLLPSFWRMARIQTVDPAAKTSKGFLKVYPSYDGNGSQRRTPRYL